MKKILGLILIAVFAGAAYYFWTVSPSTGPFPFKSSINDRIDVALENASIDVSDFGGGTVALVGGEATFGAGDEVGGGHAVSAGRQGFVQLGDPRGVVVKGEDADVLALVHISGGGTGTFQYLVHFEYVGSEDKVHEIQKVLLGDRISVDNITAEVTAPTEYEVLVSIKDRKQGEGMAAQPVESRVLTFGRVDGKLVLKAVIFGTLESHDVVLVSPMPETEVSHSFLVQGAARGPWYFEASFPIELQTVDGETLATVIAQAQGEWMTTDLVPFSTYMVAPATVEGLHMLVLKKDNPSGLPEHDKSVMIPVVIK